MIAFSHKPVMLEECMQGLKLHSGGVYFDGTVGGGGHSCEILRRTAPGGRLIATDLDDDAIAAATRRLAEFSGRFRIHKSNFKNFASVLDEEGVDELDGVLLDFGVSSFQLDEASRGFSYMQDAPLDMRMDARSHRRRRGQRIQRREARSFSATMGKNGSRNVSRGGCGAEGKEDRSTGELARLVETASPPSSAKTVPVQGKRFRRSASK